MLICEKVVEFIIHYDVALGKFLFGLILNHAWLDFFSANQSEATKARSKPLMQTLDKINQKMGRNTVAFGGINKKASWNLKRELISKRYTTN